MNRLTTGLSAWMTLFLLCTTTRLYATDLVAVAGELSQREQQMLGWIDTRREQLVQELSEHVAINTGTENISGINRYRELLAKDLQQLGFATSEYPAGPLPVLTCAGGSVSVADNLVATHKGSSPRRILLNGHMDTVFSASDDFQTLSVAADGTLHGPGVLDMKGGIVVMLNALRALSAAGYLKDANITVLFNSDEEIGSLGSRQLIEELATQHDIGLVFEGTRDNRMTRARKGLGQVRLKVTGREAHAGAAHEQGVSANLALAYQVVAIEQLTDYQRGVTVNVGVMAGGEKRNTIPGCADAYVDLRYPSVEDGEYLAAAIDDISVQTYIENADYPGLPATEVWSVLHRPVKQENPEVDAVIAQAMGLSQLIGEPIVGTIYSGGGTDGSIAQAMGLPTVDSLGLNGSGGHSSREMTSVSSLIARTKLAAVIIARQIQAQPLH